MKHSKVYSSLFIFTVILFFAGCQKNNNTIVQPISSSMENGKEMVGNESPLYQTSFINGNMEDSTNGYWEGGYLLNSGYQFHYSNKESVSPTHSLNIVASGTSNSFAYWAQTFDAASLVGKRVAVTVSAKYSNVVGDGVMLVLRGDNTATPQGTAEAFSTTQGKVMLTGSSDWKTVEVDMDPVPEGIKSLTIYMMISANSGSVYFDNLNVTVSDASPPVTNLMNGNMEAGVNSPDYWRFGSGNTSRFNFAWTTDEYLSPDHSIKISSQGSGNDFSFWTQTISASQLSNKKITLTANIKTVNLLGKGVYIAIRGDDTLIPSGSAETFVTTQGNKQITGTFDWKKFSVTLDNVPSNIKSLTFYLIYGENTSGSVYFDDLSLTTN